MLQPHSHRCYASFLWCVCVSVGSSETAEQGFSSLLSSAESACRRMPSNTSPVHCCQCRAVPYRHFHISGEITNTQDPNPAVWSVKHKLQSLCHSVHLQPGRARAVWMARLPPEGQTDCTLQVLGHEQPSGGKPAVHTEESTLQGVIQSRFKREPKSLLYKGAVFVLFHKNCMQECI